MAVALAYPDPDDREPDPLPVLWSPAPVFGYRAWQLQFDGLYGSTGERWDHPGLAARCVVRWPAALMSPPRERPAHDVPHTNRACSRCGIYAVADPAALMRIAGFRPAVFPRRRLTEYPQMAVGLVALSGKVIEHDRGWRAGYATAVALAVVTRRWYVLAADAAAVEEIFADPVAGLSTLERHPMPDEKYWDDVAADLAERLETIKFEEERRWTLGNRGE